ncbi:MAG: hypothetical protein KAS02_00425 [Candidatus Pacebacteria bacterium]|nr:hypothetical protein [Candidatus Paceibacterota bacterium]
MDEKGIILKPKLCISGAAETTHLTPDAVVKTEELGREIARQGGIVVTGATTGLPLWGAKGAKSEGGFSIGFSPADTEAEHLGFYKLPTEYMDLIIYTGFGYPGRDLILTKSVDAVFITAGRVGTIHEFTIAFEDKKPMGILKGDWATDEIIEMILEKAHRPNDKIVFDEDPKILVEKVLALVAKDKEEVYKNYNKVNLEKAERPKKEEKPLLDI